MFIKPTEGAYTSLFGPRTHPISGARSFHQGVDIAKSGNVPILASADGSVSRVGKLGTYGYVVMILHKINGKTYETNYAHLKPNILVRVGQKVRQGQQIAWMGNTGSSTGQHLHFELHVGRWATGQPNAVDPMLYIGDELYLGSQGDKVKTLQEKLNKVGYSLVVDGSFGKATETALRSFQAKAKIKVDGIYGKGSESALNKMISEANRPTSKPAPASQSPTSKKEEIYLNLPNWQKDEMAAIYKLARQKGVFTSAEHEADIKAGKMTVDQAIFLMTSIAGAVLNNGKRVK